jgi:hypothetical protein
VIDVDDVEEQLRVFLCNLCVLVFTRTLSPAHRSLQSDAHADAICVADYVTQPDGVCESVAVTIAVADYLAKCHCKSDAHAVSDDFGKSDAERVPISNAYADDDRYDLGNAVPVWHAEPVGVAVADPVTQRHPDALRIGDPVAVVHSQCVADTQPDGKSQQHPIGEPVSFCEHVSNLFDHADAHAVRHTQCVTDA